MQKHSTQHNAFSSARFGSPGVSKKLLGDIAKLLLICALGLGAVLCVVTLVRNTAADSAERLIAKAYTERRTLELRLGGAEHAPMRLERGPSASSLSQPESLIRAELVIREYLKRNPADQKWLHTKARVSLLDRDFDSALGLLRQALEIQPDSPQLLTDLASGYFERAQATGQAIDYGDAIEYLGEALAHSPDDPVALFNRAVVDEKIFFYSQAIDDWKHYLKIDATGGWADEARTRLAQIQAKVDDRNHGIAEPLLTPSDLAGKARSTKVEGVDGRIEEQLSLAITSWLPMAFPSGSRSNAGQAEAEAALSVLGDWLAKQHDDYWLRDLLTATTSPDFPLAVAALSKALTANDEGNSAAAQQYAAAAAQHFSLSHNLAGVLRARLEYIYALHITQDGAKCLPPVERWRQSIEEHPYSWLQAQYHLEAGTCYWFIGNLGKARELYQAAADEANEHRYNALYLRTQDHLASLDGTSGNFRASWTRIHEGLQRFWTGHYPAMRGYNLYYNLQESARARKQGHLQVSSWADALGLSESFSDHTLRAMAHSLMANAAMAAAQPNDAENQFRLADQQFALSPPIKSTRVARVEAETRLAEAEIGLGKLQEAKDQLIKLETDVSQLSDNFLSLLFYTNLSEAEARLGNEAHAENALHSAIGFAELDLISLKDERAKLEWSQKYSAPYRNLAELRLRQGYTAEALEIWEWYRGAGLRSINRAGGSATRRTDPGTGDHEAGHFDSHEASVENLTEVSKLLPALTTKTVLSYMRTADGYVVWAYDDRGISVHTIPASAARLQFLAQDFRRLCSDYKSDLNQVRQQGQILYNLLIAPVEDKLSSDRSLVIETDGALNGVAFDALVDKQNLYLAEHGAISSSLGLYYRSHAHPPMPLTPAASRALIVAVPTAKTPDGQSAPFLPDAADEGLIVERRFHNAKFLQDKDATIAAVRTQLASANIFHFAGHGIASPGQTGLLLADGTLTYASIQGADLSQMQLAVLSGCDTIGDLDGTEYNPDSLVRLFASAGVPRVVASRWNVDSAATKEFMELFYQHLLGGEIAIEALRNAREKLRTYEATKHPYYWAAFTEFGTN